MPPIPTKTELAPFSALVAVLGFSVMAATAHEEGAPFSGAMHDPVILHHAHIENEQRFNFFVLNGVPDANGSKQLGYESELELAYGTPNHRYGVELFLPVLNLPAPDAQGRVMGLGDMEIRPLKYSLWMRPDFVVSTASGLGLPTGSRKDGLGEGNTSFTQYLFADKALGRWSANINLGVGANFLGERDRWFEYGVGVAYSFIRGVRWGEVAPAVPAQRWVISPSLEVVGEHSFRELQVGRHTTSVAPGLSFWHVRTGWQFRMGAQVPVAGEREADSAFTIQVGNHLSWAALMGRTNHQ